MPRYENSLFGDGDEYELEGRFDPEADDMLLLERAQTGIPLTAEEQYRLEELSQAGF